MSIRLFGRRDFVARLCAVSCSLVMGGWTALAWELKVVTGSATGSPPPDWREALRTSLGVVGQACCLAGSPPTSPAADCTRGRSKAAARPEEGLSWWLQHREELDRRITDDFEHGRIRTVEGWILSETEAAVCSAFARDDRKRRD